MKTIATVRVAFAAALIAITGAAQAATGLSIAEINAVAKIATDKFAAENPDHVEHFVGYKVWKTGEESKVKVYVTHDGMNMEFNYNCHKHDDGDLECHNL